MNIVPTGIIYAALQAALPAALAVFPQVSLHQRFFLFLCLNSHLSLSHVTNSLTAIILLL